jgi:hypothetical protein
MLQEELPLQTRPHRLFLINWFYCCFGLWLVADFKMLCLPLPGLTASDTSKPAPDELVTGHYLLSETGVNKKPGQDTASAGMPSILWNQRD